MTSTKTGTPPLGELLVIQGLISREQLDEALKHQGRLVDQGLDKLLGDILVAKGYASPIQIRKVLQQQQKRIVVCGACRSEFNIYEDEAPGTPVNCPRCGRTVRTPIEPEKSSLAIPMETAPRDPGATPVAYLVLKSFDVEDEVFPIRRGDSLLIGSAATCDVVVHGEGMEPEHCRIQERNNEIHIINESPSQGTYVNGTRVDKCVLRFGDFILLGRVPLLINQGLPATPVFGVSIDNSTQRACHVGVDPSELVGMSVGSYRLIRQLGMGGMSVVYLAEQVTLGRLVALKVLRKDFDGNPKMMDRFMREARAGAKLNHPNIVAVYDAGVQGGLGFIAMEYVEGDDVGRWIKRFGKLPLDLAVSIAVQIATALDVAHQNGVIHRDVKPTNIIFSKAGVAKLLDLGIAKIREEAMLENPKAGLGTLSYMPPEQTSNAAAADQRADIYSLGATLYKMLTGQAPFRSTSVENLVKAIRRDPLPDPRVLNPVIPGSMVKILYKAMEKRPRDRYRDVRAMRADLMRVIS